jgi:hypothetical protein
MSPLSFLWRLGRNQVAPQPLFLKGNSDLAEKQQQVSRLRGIAHKWAIRYARNDKAKVNLEFLKSADYKSLGTVRR